MGSIPAIYWMVVIGVLTGLFGLILYYIAMFVRESTGTMSEVKGTLSDSRKLIQASGKVVEEAHSIVAGVKGSIDNIRGTVDEVTDSFLRPISRLTEILNSVIDYILSFLDGNSSSQQKKIANKSRK